MLKLATSADPRSNTQRRPRYCGPEVHDRLLAERTSDGFASE